jgi:hypothetical protein
MGKKKITVLNCTLTEFMTDGFDVDEKGYPRGMICKSKTTGKWAATWNMVPNEGDSGYCYDTKEAAVQQLIDWEKETRDRLAAKGKQ